MQLKVIVCVCVCVCVREWMNEWYLFSFLSYFQIQNTIYKNTIQEEREREGKRMHVCVYLY